MDLELRKHIIHLVIYLSLKKKNKLMIGQRQYTFLINLSSHIMGSIRALSIKLSLFFLISASILSSCSNTKKLPDGEKLYIRTWYKWNGKKKVEKLPFKVYDIVYTGTVRSNWSFFTFSRSGLTIYNYMQPKRNWGVQHYVWSVFSKPPVLLSKVHPENRLLKIQQGLFNSGHFDSNVELNLKYSGKDNKKVKAIYTVTFKDSYHFRKYNYFSNQYPIDRLITTSLDDSFIKPGEEYWLNNVKNERQRITDYLRNEGYFFFKPEYLIFDMDTTIGNKEIDVALRIKSNIQRSNQEKYSVNSVEIFFNTNKDSINNIDLVYDSTNNIYFQKQDYFKQKYINRVISLLDDPIYKLDNHKATLNYMNNFGIFKLSEIVYSKDSSKANTLNAHIYLTPSKPISTSLEMNFATKSNDFIGPFAVLAISHGNIFKGAERLNIQLSGGLEWQKRAKKKEYDLGLNSYGIGIQTSLEFPRFLLPFKLKNKNKIYIPKTYAIIGFKISKRVKYYQSSVSHINFGYEWRANKNLLVKIEPLTFNIYRMMETSPEFLDYLKEFPSVARSFQDQLIIGSTYSLTIEKHSKNNILKNYYNNISIDLAGNLLNLFATTESKLTASSPDKIFNATYSQYFKVVNDFRYYLALSPKSALVTRLIGGIGVPYNKSTVMPFIKQFFAGGSNDLRAFYARTVGPGSYKKDLTQSSLLLDQSGEIKIAGSLEYRFPIMYRLNGALFIDAGNVWLLNEDPSRIGGKFDFNTFYKQLAVGAGLGARIDLDYVVIRFDLAIPLRKPYKEYNKYWTFTSPHILDDYVLSFAVGYPF
ncbi:MAG: hypothetical protein DRI86_07525 [Bacteroidetes bacterium]|nr:MAG: hypothetical protein DRI86_07525 [Bacteroidota bacterium]